MTVSVSVDEGRRRRHAQPYGNPSPSFSPKGGLRRPYQAGRFTCRAERLRFDFTHFYAVQSREIEEVEEIVNEKIIDNLPVEKSTTSLDDAISKGVTALFGEKYGERGKGCEGR